MPDERGRILRSLEKTYQRGQVLFREGDESREMFILLEGVIEIRKGDRSIALVKDPDSYLGEMSSLLGVPRTATAVAHDDSRLVRIPESRVDVFFHHSPSLAMKLARTLAQRLHDMNTKYQSLLSECGGNEVEAVRTFRRLTANPYNQRFLELYCRNIGRTIAKKDLTYEMPYSSKRVSEILAEFRKAGLIEATSEGIACNEAPNIALRQRLMSWQSG
jgi:CRP-like cAMP-binding protein